MKRASGILLHVSSLPSPHGIGTLGRAAYEFADFLHAAGQHYWQILPVGPTSYGDSPYQSFSTHAGSPYFIDLELLREQGLLTAEEIAAEDEPNAGDRVNYGFLYEHRFTLLRKAYARGIERDAAALKRFRRTHRWADNYGLYMAVKEQNGMRCWDTWPEDIRLRRPSAVKRCKKELAGEIEFWCYLQLLFERQWFDLRDYVHSLGMEIIGDLPIYVAYDSADVWSEPELFQLDEQRRPTKVAGCPPDCFTEDGQLWGNPLYRWDRMAENDYEWWQRRIRTASSLFDVIRIDHFRGLESYWAVPYGDKTARYGSWQPGPDHDFIRCLKERFPELKLIAEDLGFITPEVRALQVDSGFPSMKILEFAFDPVEPSEYLPHRYGRNCICYTGTHDNEPLVQWMGGTEEKYLAFAREYMHLREDDDLIDAIIRLGMASVADTFIAQLQDYLHLGKESRMNLPGIVSTDNWSWRLKPGQLTPELAAKLKRMTELYER